MHKSAFLCRWDEPDSFVKSGKFFAKADGQNLKQNHSDVYCFLPLPGKLELIQNRTTQRLLKCFATGITVTACLRFITQI